MENVVICGGHLAPALAVIENLSEKKDYQIYYFGRKEALEGDSAKSLEYSAIRKLNIPFKPIVSARLQRTMTIHTLPSLMKFPVGFVQSFFLLLTIRPKIVASFGGYVALPVCLAAWILQIPIITHEQTHYLGLANRIIARLAQVLCLSFEDTANIPKGVKTSVTGNPIRESIVGSKDNNVLNFGDKRLPLIFITGGNLGSRVINETIAKILPSLCTKYRLLHQCGNADTEKDFRYLSECKNQLPASSQKNYTIIQQINPSVMGSIYRSVSFVIGRAGANTVNEVLTFGVPSIFIPLPWAGQNEQEKNALTVQSLGAGEIIKQAELTPQFLVNKISTMMENISFYRHNAEKQSKLIDSDTAEQIVKLIGKYITSER